MIRIFAKTAAQRRTGVGAEQKINFSLQAQFPLSFVFYEFSSYQYTHMQVMRYFSFLNMILFDNGRVCPELTKLYSFAF